MLAASNFCICAGWIQNKRCFSKKPKKEEFINHSCKLITLSRMDEVTLLIEQETFKVKKELLCEHSDYFRAMFSGNYKENDQKEVTIDVVDATSMKIILEYMEIGMIDLSDHPTPTISDLAMAANFLQITELVKQIEYVLEIQLSLTNWMETMAIAENALYSKLEQVSAAFGLYSFQNMKPAHIPSIHRLFWYLSHPYLDTTSELAVFEFGLDWITHTETGIDALLIILGCLDMKRLKLSDLVEIEKLMTDYTNSLAAKVVECLVDLSIKNNELSSSFIIKQKSYICEKFTERVYVEVLNLVTESKSRDLTFVPAVPIWETKEAKPGLVAVPHHMYTFSVQNGFEKWLEIAEKNLWGFSITSWGLTRVVVAGGEHGRGTGIFMRDIKVYDTLKKEWVMHGVELPQRRHAGLAILGDSLFIVGGVGGFRIVLSSADIYDLKERTHRKIAKLPDVIQNPAACSHEGRIYVSGHNSIYRYEDMGNFDRWVRVIGTDIRMSHMLSYKGYIYCTQNYFSYLYRFKPDIDNRMEMVTGFTNPPAAICNLGDRLMFFTRTMCGNSNMLAVEEYSGRADEKPKVIWSQSDSEMKINDVAGACNVVLTTPPLHKEVSQYHRRYLSRYYDQ